MSFATAMPSWKKIKLLTNSRNKRVKRMMEIEELLACNEMDNHDHERDEYYLLEEEVEKIDKSIEQLKQREEL